MIHEKLKVILDTNILLVSISRKSEIHWIFKKFLEGEYTLCISNDILMEYEEIILNKIKNPALKDYIMDILLLSDNVKQVIPYFNLQLIDVDKDDNKFVDCAFAANADYIVTHDKHFNVLKDIDFPTINVVNVNEFKDILSSQIIH